MNRLATMLSRRDGLSYGEAADVVLDLVERVSLMQMTGASWQDMEEMVRDNIDVHLLDYLEELM